jgi:hypothetical protein
MEFLDAELIIRYQQLSHRFYDYHVPNTLTSVVCDFDWSKILKYSQYKLVSTILPSQMQPELNLLYIGTEHDFSSIKFHQLCDD